MKVILAGYNIDVNEMGKSGEPTPETIAAAYARISRDPRSVDELREEAIKDVAKARKSCENIVYGFGHACYDDKTDVLTADGWKNWRDVTKNDLFATLSKERGIEYHRPIGLYSSVYNGKMYRINSRYVDLLVTPNHNLYICYTSTKNGRKKDDNDFHLVEASLVGDRSFALKRDGNWRGGKFHVDYNLLKLLGFAIGDGSIEPGRKKNLRFHLKKERKIKYLLDLCNSLGWRYNFEKGDHQDLWIPDCHVDFFYMIYSDKREKRIPHGLIYNLNKESLCGLYDGLINSDGSVCGTGECYDTTSVELLNQFQHLSLHVGKCSTISDRSGGLNIKRNNISNRVFKCEINKKENRDGMLSVSDWVDFSGDVFCAEVPNNTLYIRRNGKPIWCGNSVAEHAVFNIDIINVSRLAVENIQHSRLCSYMEKSQRYQKLTNDFYIPAELNDVDKKRFEMYNAEQMEYYKVIYDKIKRYLLSRHEDKGKKKALINKAKEDARYVTTLAMYAQMGMTVNARTLESMITRLMSSYLAEENRLGQTLLCEVMKIVPSLVKYRGPVDKVDYGFHGKRFSRSGLYKIPQVKLVNFTPSADNILIGSIIFNNADPLCDHVKDIVSEMTQDEKMDIVRRFVSSINCHSSMSREFEMMDFVFEIRLSASAFAQLKRHRVATILKQPYDLNLIPSCPQTVDEAGALDDFVAATDNSYDMCQDLSEKYGPVVGDYALCQAHNRVVIFKINARELYHFARLRCDCHAQWEIREIADEVVKLAKEKAPLTCIAACGKDTFDEVKSEILKGCENGV